MYLILGKANNYALQSLIPSSKRISKSSYSDTFKPARVGSMSYLILSFGHELCVLDLSADQVLKKIVPSN